MQIPSIGSWRAKSLLKWRRGLEQRFVFDPASGVPSEARVESKEKMSALRFHLERALIEVRRHLHKMSKRSRPTNRNNNHKLRKLAERFPKPRRTWKC